MASTSAAISTMAIAAPQAMSVSGSGIAVHHRRGGRGLAGGEHPQGCARVALTVGDPLGKVHASGRDPWGLVSCSSASSLDPAVRLPRPLTGSSRAPREATNPMARHWSCTDSREYVSMSAN